MIEAADCVCVVTLSEAAVSIEVMASLAVLALTLTLMLTAAFVITLVVHLHDGLCYGRFDPCTIQRQPDLGSIWDLGDARPGVSSKI